MVAVRTGFPSPMQPMGSFPSAPLPAGQTPVPASVPPMPLAGFPPPPVKLPMAQQGSNAPRRRRFGDSLEGMLGRNVFAPQQQMVAPGMPMMRTPMPQPMAMGGAVQYFANGGNANQQAAASMMSAGIGNIGGKAITSGAQSVQDSFASSAKRRRKKRREKQRRLAAERAAAEQAIRDAEAAAQAVPAQQNNPNIAGPMESALQNFGGTAFQSAASSPAAPEVFIPPSGGIDATPPGFGAAPPPPANTGMSEGLGIVNQMQDAANLQAALGAGIDATPPGFGATSIPEVFVPEVNPASGFASNFMNIEKPDRILDREAALFPDLRDDDPAFTQNIIPSEVVPENPFTYDIGAIGFGDNREDITASESVENAMLGMLNPDPSITAPPSSTGITVPEGTAVLHFGSFAERERSEAEIERLKERLEGFPTNYYIEPFTKNGQTIYRIRGAGFNNFDDAARAASAIIDQVNVIPILTKDSFTTGGLGLPQAGENIFEQNTFAPEFPALPGNRGFTPSGTQIAPEAATVTPTENFESTKAMLESNVFDPDKLDPRGDQIVSPTGTGIGQKITPPKAGTGGSDRDDKSDPRLKLIPKGEDGKPVVDLDVLRNTGLLEIYLENLANPDERLNRTPQVPGAAQTQLLTDAFNMASKDPNFLEQVIGKVVKNLTFGTFDPNERNKAQAQAILDAYLETGTFAYDSEKDALDLSDTPEGRANFEKLQEMSAGDGQEIGTIGVYDAEGNVVGNNNTYVNTKDGVVVENIFDKLSSSDDSDSSSDTTTTDDDTNYTTDKDGNIVCNDEGYIYNPETKMCEPPKEEEVDGTPGSGIGTGTSGESFEDVLKRVVVAAPDVAPISANVKPMQEGGMAGLNRAADNFLQALAG